MSDITLGSSTVLDAGTLDMFDLSDFTDFAEVFDNPEAYIDPRRSTPIVIGDPTQFLTTLRYFPGPEVDDITAQAELVVTGGTWTRLSQRRQRSVAREGKPAIDYEIASGVFRDMHIAMMVTLDGKRMPLEDFLFNLYQRASKKPIDKTDLAAWEEGKRQFLATAADFSVDLRGRMPMTWQHMRANEEGLAAAFDLLKACGGVDTTSRLASGSSITRQMQLPADQGLQLVSFDVNRANRDISQTNQGFLDFGNSLIENLSRVMRLRTEATARKRQLQSDIAGPKAPTDKKVKETNEEIESLRRQAAQWAGNWGGAQQEAKIVNGKIQLFPRWWPVNVPVGRFSCRTDPQDPESVQTVDLWTDTRTQTVTDDELLANAGSELVDLTAQIGGETKERPDDSQV